MPLLKSGEVNCLADYNFDIGVDEAGDRLLVVDFGADWCEPCMALEPCIEALAVELSSDIYVAAVDLDHSPELTDRFNVMSIPLVLMLRRGEVVRGLQGALPKDVLKREIDIVLKMAP